MASRIAEGAAALVLGLIVGVIGTFGHQLTWRDFGIPIPIGVVAGLVAVTCLLAGIRLAVQSRLLAGLAAFGVVAAVAILALPGANGSVLLPDNLYGVVWALGPTLIAVVVLAWPNIPGQFTGVRSGSGPQE